MSIEDMRKKNQDGKYDKLLKAMSRTSLGRATNYTEEEYYYPERDDSGNGSAIIRFLPGLESEDYPYYVERLSHGFQSINGQWYIENCPKTINFDNPCPSCDHGNELKDNRAWDDIPDDDKNKIRPFFHKKAFYANILIIKDPATPENEGKIFKFKFGKQILDMINARSIPQDDGFGNITEPADVFDIDSGVNFKFIIRRKKKRVNYDNSCFEEEITACPEFNEENQHELLPIRGKDKFKSIEESTKRFNLVMGISNKKISKSAENMISKEDVKVQNNNTGDDVPFDLNDTNTAEKDNLEYFDSLVNSINS